MNKIRERLQRVTKEDFVRGAAIYAVVVFLLVFLVCPLATLFVKAFQDKDGLFVGLAQFREYFTSRAMVYSIGNTFVVAIWSTVISVALAFFFAYALSRKNVPCRSFFRYVGMIPIFAPTMLLGIALIYLFGNQGILTSLGIEIPLYGKAGIIIAESIYCFPAATTILMVAFSAADNRLYEAAETMGTSAFRKMVTITIPNVKYGLINAIFVSFTYSFTDFGAPSVVGGNYNVLATDVYKQVVGQQNFNMGAVVGMILLFPAILSFVVDWFTNKKQSAAINSKSVPYQIKPHPASDFAATLFCIIVTLAMLLFFAVALFASLIKLWPYNLTFTLDNYNLAEAGSGSGLTAFRNSILISLISAFLGTFITFVGAYMIEKTQQKFVISRKIAYFLSITPLAIPGTVVGLSFIMFFNASSFAIPFTEYALVNPLHGIYGTIWIIVFANLIHFFSVPFSTATTALKRLDKEFETVSESLSVPFYRTFRKVTVPLCFPAICEMWVYFFVNSLVTVSAVVFLYSPTAPITSVMIVSMQGAGQTAPAAAMCMLLLFINLIVRLLYEGLRHYLEARKKRQ
ncbi:phosphonate ABC transporter permease [Lachnoclostridium sp. An169]|uniref:putative 2-aminoethylphosphonate ABC transporter permease subunit n=1 Tax=Lachnoclostridium sp. An169 TaxID=1965569 RepID=UPI000B3A8345|nr:putative 2-aminoethylphosphonate ABC transporter permease subunit [Lachnoclostridium sp. An169]OUP84426.1 phosphonate ABC transporter permease [Lachnoclostridium sp. An169]